MKYAALQQNSLPKVLALPFILGVFVVQNLQLAVIDSFSTSMV